MQVYIHSSHQITGILGQPGSEHIRLITSPRPLIEIKHYLLPFLPAQLTYVRIHTHTYKHIHTNAKTKRGGGYFVCPFCMQTNCSNHGNNRMTTNLICRFLVLKIRRPDIGLIFKGYSLGVSVTWHRPNGDTRKACEIRWQDYHIILYKHGEMWRQEGIGSDRMEWAEAGWNCPKQKNGWAGGDWLGQEGNWLQQEGIGWETKRMDWGRGFHWERNGMDCDQRAIGWERKEWTWKEGDWTIKQRVDWDVRKIGWIKRKWTQRNEYMDWHKNIDFGLQEMGREHGNI